MSGRSLPQYQSQFGRSLSPSPEIMLQSLDLFRVKAFGQEKGVEIKLDRMDHAKAARRQRQRLPLPSIAMQGRSGQSFAATNEREGSEIASQIVSALLERDIMVLFVSHMYEFARSFLGREGVLFLRADRDDDGTRSYRLQEAKPLPTSHGRDLYNAYLRVLQPVPSQADTGLCIERRIPTLPNLRMNGTSRGGVVTEADFSVI